MTDPTFAGFRAGEDPWVTHWRWIAVRNGIVISDLRAMHLNETKGGLPTGRCRCGLPAPCPTAERLGAYTTTLNDPCDCMRDEGKSCPATGNEPAPDAAS